MREDDRNGKIFLGRIIDFWTLSTPSSAAIIMYVPSFSVLS